MEAEAQNLQQDSGVTIGVLGSEDYPVDETMEVLYNQDIYYTIARIKKLENLERAPGLKVGIIEENMSEAESDTED